MAQTAGTQMKTPDVEPLKSLIRDGSRKAQSIGAEVLVSYAQRIDPVDLIEVFTAASEHSSDRWYWEHPGDNRTQVSIGVLTGVTPPRNVRFQEVGRYLRQYLSSATVASADDAAHHSPVFNVAFSFDPRVPQDRLVWQGFPSTYLQTPRLTIIRSNDEFTLIQNAFVSPAMDTDALFTSAAEFVEGITASIGRSNESNLVIDEAAPDKENESEIRQFIRAISQAEAAVHARDLEIMNVARRTKVTTNGIYREARILQALRSKLPACQLVAVGRHGSTFIGYSTDILAQTHGERVASSIAAGSIRRSDDDNLDQALARQILQMPQEVEHHELCVDHMFEVYEARCSDVDVSPDPEVRPTPDRHVLYSSITGKLDSGTSVVDLLANLHPPVRATGYPADQSLDLLQNHAGPDRGWFSAPVGWIDLDGNATFISTSHGATIRAPVLNQQRAYLFTTAAVHSGADPDDLISQTDQELATLRNALRS